MNAILNFEASQAINLNVDLKYARFAALLVQGLALAIAAIFGSFLAGNAVAEAIVSPIGHLEGLAQAAGLVGIYTCLAALPVLMYIGHKKSATATVAAVLVTGFILGFIFSVAML